MSNTTPPEGRRRIRTLAAIVRELATELNRGRPVTAELDAAVAELADELDRYNLLGELRMDDDYPRDAALLTA